MEFIYMVHSDTEAGHWFPNEPGVENHFKARGWKLTDPPEDKPFVSKHGDVTPDEEWVTLVHPELDITHDFPNNLAAIEGAHDAGWLFPEEVKPKAKSSAKSAEKAKEKE
jgi:hypothetical protein